MFREGHADLNSIEAILAIPEEEFVEQYATSFDGDRRKARRAYREAQRIQERTALLWANVKDAVASPSIKEALFNNIPKSFVDHLRSIPRLRSLIR